MKVIIRNYFVTSLFALLTFTTQSFAEPNLPVSSQTKENDVEIEDEIEIVSEIQITAEATTATTTNPKLKTGKACSDEDLSKLEEVKGELFEEIPMAETIPCVGDECKDLEAAKLKRDNYKKLKDALTIKCGD